MLRQLSCLVILLATIVTVSHSAQPWDTPFAKDTQSILAAARTFRTDSDGGLVMLLESWHFRIDAKGLCSTTLRRVYLVESEHAQAVLGSAALHFRPWYEEPPKLRARVITAQGRVHLLDPATVADSPTRDPDEGIFSDTRVMQAPLPAVSAGSVVEYEFAIREKQPLLDAGQVKRVSVTPYVPVQRFHVVIEADKAVALNTNSYRIPDEALKQTAIRGGTRVEMELTDIKESEDLEMFAPADTSEDPYLAFSTGKDWQSIASSYHRIVESKLSTPLPSTWVQDLPSATDPAMLVSALSSRMHKQIRYTGVEFGEAAIVPRTPAEVLERRYGDCKDKSVFLVSALREAGLPAYLALLSAGFHPDVPRDLPGLGLFNHAIVYVDTVPPVWIDATATRSGPSAIPAANQGRLALIVRPETTGLVQIPELSSKDNWQRVVVNLRLHDYGLSTIEESYEAGGTWEARLRESFGGSPEEQRKTVENYAETRFVGDLESFEISDFEDLSVPFRVSMRVKNAKAATTALDDATAAIHPDLAFQDLPFPFLLEQQDDAQPREADFVFPQSHRAEVLHRIHLPSFFVSGELPPPVELQIGEIRLAKTYTLLDEGVLEVLTSFEIAKRRISSSEFSQLHAGLSRLRHNGAEFLSFVPATNELLALGKTEEALDLVNRLVDASPDRAISYVRRGRLLLSLGLGLAARTEAKKATEMEPELAAAWQMAGVALQHSTTGRPYVGDWDRQGAEKCFRKAIELNPDDFGALTSLAVVLEHNAIGSRYSTGPQLNEAAELYRKLLKVSEFPGIRQNLIYALLYGGQLDAARDEIRKTSPANQVFMELIAAGAQHGAARVLTDTRLAAMDASSRAAFFVRVAFTMVVFRRFDDVRLLADGAFRLDSSQEWSTFRSAFAELRQHEKVLVAEDDPVYPIQQLVIRSAQAESSQEALSPESLSSYVSSHWNPESAKSRLGSNSWRDVLTRTQTLSVGLTSDVLLDFALGMPMTTMGDDDTGFVIATSIPDAIVIYVVREDAAYKVLGVAGSLDGVGSYVLNLLDRGDIKGARVWLDRVVTNTQSTTASGDLAVVRSLWSGVGDAARGPEAIRMAAASLIGTGSGSARALEILRDGRSTAKTEYDRSMIDLALAETYAVAKDWPELLAAGKRLMLTRQHAERGFAWAVKAATAMRNWEELEAAAGLMLVGDSTHANAIASLVAARAWMHDLRTAEEWLAKLEEASYGEHDSRPLVLSAWLAIRGQSADQERLSRLVTQLSEGSRSDARADRYLVLAMLHVLRREPALGIQALHQALSRYHTDSPDGSFWIVYGRLCRELGFPEAAEQANALAMEARQPGEYFAWASTSEDL